VSGRRKLWDRLGMKGGGERIALGTLRQSSTPSAREKSIQHLQHHLVYKLRRGYRRAGTKWSWRKGPSTFNPHRGRLPGIELLPLTFPGSGGRTGRGGRRAIWSRALTVLAADSLGNLIGRGRQQDR
jgi:hypothetical protein